MFCFFLLTELPRSKSRSVRHTEQLLDIHKECTITEGKRRYAYIATSVSPNVLFLSSYRVSTIFALLACVAGVRRGGKGERQAREAREDRTRVTMQNPASQLWNVMLSILSNQSHTISFVTKSVGANGFFYFLFLLFCTEN